MRVKVTVPIDLKKNPKLTLNAVLYFIADSLRCEKIDTVVDNEETIRFSGGVFRSFWDWAPLSTIYGGEIRLQTDKEKTVVVSRLSFVDTVLMATALVGLLAYVNYHIFLLGKDDLIFYVVAWFGVIAGNMLLSLKNWRYFIRQCVREATDRVYLSKEDLMANQLQPDPLPVHNHHLTPTGTL